MDLSTGKAALALRERIVSNFEFEHWEEVGLLTGLSDQISKHPRLLRSLHWGDEDYSGNVLNILRQIADKDSSALSIIDDYINSHFEGETHYISAKPSEKRITFSPSVFEIPNVSVENSLVAIMMPFKAELEPVFKTIRVSCNDASYRALRVDDIWEESTIIQDIFNLLFRSSIVIVDFTGKNPNVMYETGIAHTLGKLVIPISQNIDDVPFDMKHHRVLQYLPNSEGLESLKTKLTQKLKQVSL